MKRALFYLILVLLSIPTSAQVTINFLPAVNGQSLDGLSIVQLINAAGTTQQGQLSIAVKDASGMPVVNILVPRIVVRAGVNNLNKGMLGNARVQFGGGPEATTLSQTGRFPEGEYEYCYEFSAENAKPGGPPTIYENCFQHVLQPTTPLMLIDPYDGAEICNTRPNFSWQPPMPLLPDMRFRIVVVPVKEKQDPVEALANNRPVINVAELRHSNIVYPVQSPDLVKEERYAWQVTAYANKTIVTQSEIWSFRIHCDDSIPPSEDDSYRELKVETDKNFYTAPGKLRFAFTNYGQAGKLDYEIVDLANPAVPLKKLPRVTMQPGLNRIALELSDIRGMQDGNQYILKVKNATNQELTLRFIYQEK